jgi:hypothetical protein
MHRRRGLREECVRGCLHSASTHTVCVRTVTGVYSDGARVPAKPFDQSMICQSRAANKPFCGARSIKTVYYLCAITFCASISWQIKAVQGAHAQLEAWTRRLPPLNPSTPRPAICWRACVPSCPDKTPRLERPAAPDTHRLTGHADVARRCHTRLQDSPTLRVQCSRNLKSFSLMRRVERMGLVRCTRLEQRQVGLTLVVYQRGLW